jgi:hypothetical protein
MYLCYHAWPRVDLGARFAIGAEHVLDLRTGLESLSMEVVDPRFGVVRTFGVLVGADQSHDHIVGEVPLVRASPYQVLKVGFHRSSDGLGVVASAAPTTRARRARTATPAAASKVVRFIIYPSSCSWVSDGFKVDVSGERRKMHADHDPFLP